MRWLRRITRKSAPGSSECARVGAVVQSYLDGEYEGDSTWIADHLDACRDCGLESETLQRIKDAIAAEGRPDAATRSRLQEFAERLSEGGLDAVDAT